MKLQKLLFAALLIFASSNVFAQDTNKDSHNIEIGIPEVALLDIETSTGDKNISLTATAPDEAGEKVTFNQTNNDLWINYSSIVSANNLRNVTVKITSGEVPSGIELTVVANAYQGDGEGTMGTAVANPIVLNTNDTNIIEGIGSSYTGNGATKGHNLTYKIAQSSGANAYSNLRFDESTTLEITYTLSDI